MVKRAILVLVTLMLVLSACANPPDTTPEVNAPAVSGGVFLPRGLLPDTEYEIPESPVRWYPEVTRRLIPSDDYDRIWPYPGAFVEAAWMHLALYGFCDEHGRIICDPFYNQVKLIEKDGQSLYVLTKNHKEQGRNAPTYTLAATDGSWVKEYEDVLYEHSGFEVGSEYMTFRWREALTYDYIAVCDGGRWGAIDYEGNEVLPCTYTAPVCFSEGLAAVLSEDEATYTYIDTTGAVALGPYETPPRQEDPFDIAGRGPLPLNHGLLFCQGLARFYDDGKFGVIDRNGNVVVDAQYQFITLYSHGMAQFMSGNMRGLIDDAGHVLLEPTEWWFTLEDDGTVFLDWPSGQFLLDPKTGERKPWKSTTYSGGSDGVLVEWDGGSLNIPEADSVIFLDNGNFAVTYRDEKDIWKIVDRSGKVVAGPFDGVANYMRDGFLHVYFFDQGEGYSMTLYDETGRRVLPEGYIDVTPFDEHFLVRQGAVAGLVDEDGIWIIRVPIYDYVSD